MTTPTTRLDIARFSCSNDLYDAADALIAASARWKLALNAPTDEAAVRISNLDRAQRICSELARQVLALGRTDVATAYAEAGWLMARDANERLDERHGRAAS